MNERVVFYTLAFGRDEYHLQSQLLIISFLKYRSPGFIFRVYTDNPDFFELFREEIDIVHIDKAYLQECIGEHKGYVFSVKLNLIKRVYFEDEFNAFVFLDTDMIVLQSLDTFVLSLLSGKPAMYQRERKYAKESKKEYWNALRNIDVLGHAIHKESSQWSSGVVGLPKGLGNKMQDASIIMDNLYEYGVKQHTLEQVAISVVLENANRLTPSTDYFIHYYANKNAWEPLYCELDTLKKNSGNINLMKEWFENVSVFPAAEVVKEGYFYRLFSKWKNSLKKRIIYRKK
ncbi:hypothetical protein ABRP57_08380 [Pectobacterium aroidearum]|uniref:hypothetical protein n=1 Tax=Pectobacterium aroidearum TaxID=1201031 RepID=UPI0032EDB690